MSSTAFAARLLASASAMAIATGGFAYAQAPGAPAPAEIEQIVVTGTRLQTTGFNAPTPVTVLGEEQFQRRAANAVIDVLQEVPSFRPAGGPNQGTGGTFGPGQAVLELRALGGERTLVLIDGRRPVPTNASGTFDTNQVPASLIARTEVVTGGASAAYGSDAVAGVVNFILNDRLEGFRGSVQYGTSQESDADGWTLSGAWGTSFANDRGHFIVGGDWSKIDPSGTMYSRDWGRSETAWVPVAAPRPAGVPAWVLADDVHMRRSPAALIVGCNVGGVQRNGAACPLNLTTFNEAGNPVPFQLGSLVGSFSQVGGYGEGRSPGYMNYLRTGSDRYSVLGRASYDFTDSITGFAQVSAGGFEVESRTAPAFTTRPVWTGPAPFLINADNPFIPTAIRTQMAAQGITQLSISDMDIVPEGTVVRNRSKFVQGVIGLRGELANNWTWDVTYTQGRSNFKYNPTGYPVYANFYSAIYAVPGPNGPVCGPSATNPNWNALTPGQRAGLDAGCVPYNIFTSNRPQAQQDYILSPFMQTTVWDRKTAQANISGAVFEGWAGPITAAVGGEWRDDEVVQTLNGNNSERNANGAYYGPAPTDGRGAVSVYEYYGEAGVPLARDVTFFNSLDLNGAIRRTHYSTSGWVTTWKIGGSWEPIEMIRFRATRSRDIRAPSLPNLFIRGPFGAGSFINPINNVAFNALSASGNNPGLEPERADTSTIGVVFQPSWQEFGRFRFSADWYRITINDVIAGISGQQLINLYYGVGAPANPDYAQFLTFDPACTPAPGNTCGGITVVRSPPLNLNLQRTVGMDFELDYTAPLDQMGVPGQLRITTLASYLQDLYTVVPGANGTVVRQANIAGSIPRWRGTTNINYQLNRFGVNLTARWFSHAKLNANGFGPEDPGYNPALSTSMSRNRMPAEVYYSLGGTYDVLQRDGKNLQAYIVIDNLLNTDPPKGVIGTFQALQATPPTTVGYMPWDTIGRYFKFGFRFQY